MRSTTPPPPSKTGGSFLERRTANSHHVGRYLAGRKEGLGMVHTFSPSLSLVVATFEASQPSGLGSIIVPEPQPTRFVGSLQQGKPHGVGVLVSATGIYKGHFAYGTKQGFGIEVDWGSAEDRRGFFTNGRLQGVALIKKAELERNLSPGRMNESQLHGNSRYAYSPGFKSTVGGKFSPQRAQTELPSTAQARFVGHVQDGVPHGSGYELTEEGEQYWGFYSWGRRHGVGKLLRAGNAQTKEYLGDWKDGSRTGFGFEKSKGSTYFGTFSQGKREGVGECTYDDGSQYVGQMMAGKKHGFGRLKTSNGEFYIGNWRHEQQDGIGFYSQMQPSRKYFGIWRNGEFQQEKGVDLSVQDQEPKDLDLTRANDEDSGFLLNPRFFDEATSKIIEIDQKLTTAKHRIKTEFLSVITDYSRNMADIDKCSRDVQIQISGALTQFSYLWLALVKASNNAGFDISSAAYLVSSMEKRGFLPSNWTNDPPKLLDYGKNNVRDDASESQLDVRPEKRDKVLDNIKPPMNSNMVGASSSNNDPLREIFSLERDGTSVTDSDRNTIGKMGGSLLKSKPGVSLFNPRDQINEATSQIDTPRSNQSQEQLPRFRGRPASRSQITIPKVLDEPVRNLTPRAGQSQSSEKGPSQKRQYRIDPTALGSSGQDSKEGNETGTNSKPFEAPRASIPKTALVISMMPDEPVYDQGLPKQPTASGAQQQYKQSDQGKENRIQRSDLNPPSNSTSAKPKSDLELSRFVHSDLQNTVSDLRNQLQLERLKCDRIKKKVDPDVAEVRAKLASEVLRADKQTTADLELQKAEIERKLQQITSAIESKRGFHDK